MLTDSDKLYRENLRKKLGLGDTKVVEEDDVIDQDETVIDAPKEASIEASGLHPDAESLLNEVLQFVNELESKHSPRMVKSLWVYLEDNKDKIAKVIIGKVEKAEKAI
jgi:hypothetical protein